MMVHDLVAYGRLPHRSWLSTLQEEDEAVIHWAIKVCNLEELAYRPLHSLSGGNDNALGSPWLLHKKHLFYY
ncbi:hypothetical protein [Micromonospora zhanjiangensis]